MALSLLAGLLALVCWRSEKWMHQHVFKVGWLLSRNSKTSVIFYYTAFLPGVLLHELVYWLAAGVCNVRATRSVQLPQQDEIDELQLGFVRLARSVHPLKRVIIEFAPLAVALLVLWFIAIDILDVNSTWAIASAGNLDDLAWAISQLTAKPDFWLWFYLAFTIANTMIPTMPAALKGRRKSVLSIGITLLASVLLGLGDLRYTEFSLTVEKLLSSLTIILLSIIGSNLVMVLILGILEALVEGVTGHSATFVDGKLTTLTRQEARQLRERERRRRPQQPAPAKPAAPLKSIYALPLPIPGPPGIEPVSRNITAVLDLHSDKEKSAKKVSSKDFERGVASVKNIERMPSKVPASEEPQTSLPPSRPPVSASRLTNDLDTELSKPRDDSSAGALDLEKRTFGAEYAPFSRPFIGEGHVADNDDHEIELEQRETPFARPFALPPEIDTPTDAIAVEPAVSRDSTPGPDEIVEADDIFETDTRNRTVSRTKPVPKPSPKPTAKLEHEVDSFVDDELRYEPLEDDDVYDDELYADDSS